MSLQIWTKKGFVLCDMKPQHQTSNAASNTTATSNINNEHMAQLKSFGVVPVCWVVDDKITKEF